MQFYIQFIHQIHMITHYHIIKEIQYHQVDGHPCGFYSVYANVCRFCTKCGNVYILSKKHLHAVVHQNCGAGTSCPCAAYWKEHAAENTGYQKALEQYEHKSIY